MDTEMHNIANKLIPNYDFIYSLYDLTLILVSKKAKDFVGKDLSQKKLLTLFDVFEHEPADISSFVSSAPEKGEREFVKKVKNKAEYKFKTKYADFEYDDEMFRAVKVVKHEKLKGKN